MLDPSLYPGVDNLMHVRTIILQIMLASYIASKWCASEPPVTNASIARNNCAVTNKLPSNPVQFASMEDALSHIDRTVCLCSTFEGLLLSESRCTGIRDHYCYHKLLP